MKPSRFTRRGWCALTLSLLLAALALLSALVVFGGMSVWKISEEGGATFSPVAIALAAFSLVVILRRKLSVMATIFLCALLGLAAHAVL